MACSWDDLEQAIATGTHMAPSPSDPYKSRFVRTVLAQTRRWLDRSQTTVRRLQVAASWGTQVVLYPLYALFQGARLLGQQVDQTIQLGDADAATPPAATPAIATTRRLTVDSPLQHVLQAVQPWLPAEVTVALPEVELVIRAIASTVETKALVLVDAENQVLEVLTQAQQQQLAQFIEAQLVQQQYQQQFWARPKQFLHTVVQAVRSRLPAQFQAASLPSFPALPTALTAEAPLQASLQWVQRILPALPFTEVLQLPAAPETTLTIARPSLLAPPVVRQMAAPVAAIAPNTVRGVASSLTTRSLVLTTAQNTVLDILTPDQQQQVQRRIIWEVAHYNRYLRLCQQTQRLSPLRPPHPASPLLPPVRAFRWLMAWMQSGPIAAATNLFQEATITTCPLPAQAPPPQLRPAPGARSQFDSRSLDQLSLLWDDLRHHLGQQLQQRAWARWFLAPPAAKADSAVPPSTTAIAPAAPSHPVPTANGQLNRAQTNSMGRSPVYPPTAFGSLDLDATTAANSYQDDLYIDADATLLGYEHTVLERVMRWLDQCFVWIETKLSQLWQWCTQRWS